MVKFQEEFEWHLLKDGLGVSIGLLAGALDG